MVKLQETETSWGKNYTITIPRKYVELVGWKKGDELKFTLIEGKLCLEKI